MSAPLVASVRHTTSSRSPGRVNVGTVYSFATQWLPCEECGGTKSDCVPPGRHAPHVVTREGRHVLVNCRNQEIR